MSDDEPIETRLRAALYGAADLVTAQPDAADVHRRAAHRRRRRRATTSGIAAVVLIAIGVVAWPDSDDRPIQVTPSASTTVPTPTTTVPMTERTTASGWTVRTAVGPFTLRAEFDRGLPAVCSADTQLDITFFPPGSTADADGVRSVAPLQRAAAGFVGVYSSYFRADSGLTAGTVPYLLMMAINTDLPFTTVRASFQDGTSDTADLVDGATVLITGAPGTLSHDAANPAYAVTAFELVAADGTTLALPTTPGNALPKGMYDASGQGVPSLSEEARGRGECEPAPTPLPAAGESPTDPIAAEAAVRVALTTAFDGSLPVDDRAAAFADPTLAPAIIAEVSAAYPDASTRGMARVTELVFTSPTTASIRWDVMLGMPAEGDSMGEGSVYNSLIGEVVLVDGSWRVTSETACSAARKLAPEACAGVG